MASDDAVNGISEYFLTDRRRLRPVTPAQVFLYDWAYSSSNIYNLIIQLVIFTYPVHYKEGQAPLDISFEQTHVHYWLQKRFPVMESEKNSEYETYGLNSHGEYATPYTHRNASGSKAGFWISARSMIGWRSCHDRNLQVIVKNLYWAKIRKWIRWIWGSLCRISKTFQLWTKDKLWNRICRIWMWKKWNR